MDRITCLNVSVIHGCCIVLCLQELLELAERLGPARSQGLSQSGRLATAVSLCYVQLAHCVRVCVCVW